MNYYYNDYRSWSPNSWWKFGYMDCKAKREHFFNFYKKTSSDSVMKSYDKGFSERLSEEQSRSEKYEH